jgi:beta-glucosidase
VNNLKKSVFILIIIMALFLTACQQVEENTPSKVDCLVTPNDPSCDDVIDDPINDPDDMSDEFIEGLLNALTLEEKVGQMIQAERGYITPEQVKMYNIGSVLSGGGSFPTSYNDSLDTWAEMIDRYQTNARSSSSGIPILYGIDAVHGNNNVYGSTIFPHNINLGMANDPDLMYEIGVATAKEMKAMGAHWNFSPAVSVVENISWGRSYEGYSESVAHVSPLAVGYTQGLQSEGIVATAKHYLGDGGTESGIDQGNTIATEAEVRDRYLPPYEALIDAGVDTIMISFSALNGTKMTANEYWITDVLKAELGFDGIVLSDWNAVHQLEGDFQTQLETAINAGIDMLMEPTDWEAAYMFIVDSVESGAISENRIDDAVERILTVKYNTGLFEDTVEEIDQAVVYSNDHQSLAKTAAIQSFVLLKNNDVLPLSKNESIYVMGPGSDHVGYLCGGWTTNWQGNTNADIGVGQSILDALTSRLEGETGRVVDSMEESDVVVVVFVETPYSEGVGDTPTPTLFEGLAHPDNEQAYEEALEAKAAGKTVIGILSSGRPLVLYDTLESFDAFFAIFLPGSEGGPAVSDVLVGDAPFSGTLSFTWPSTVDDIGHIVSMEDYASLDKLYPYGYGLTTEGSND